MEKKELLIIMPAHNEEKNLPGLLASWRRRMFPGWRIY